MVFEPTVNKTSWKEGLTVSVESDQDIPVTPEESVEEVLARVSQNGAEEQPEVKVADAEAEVKDSEEAVETAPAEVASEQEIDSAQTAPVDSKSAKIAALIKKEKENQKRAASMREREALLAEKEKRLAALEERRALYVKNPLQALEDAGLTFEQVAHTVLNNGVPTTQMQQQNVQSEIEQLKAEFKRRDEEAAKRESERIEAMKREEQQRDFEIYRDEVKSFVSSDDASYDYPALAALGADDATKVVIDYVSNEFQKTGKQISKREAAKMIEAQLSKYAENLMSLKAKQRKPVAEPKRTVTLTNKTAAKTPVVSFNSEPKSDDEAWSRALAALQGFRKA